MPEFSIVDSLSGLLSDEDELALLRDRALNKGLPAAAGGVDAAPGAGASVESFDPSLSSSTGDTSLGSSTEAGPGETALDATLDGLSFTVDFLTELIPATRGFKEGFGIGRFGQNKAAKELVNLRTRQGKLQEYNEVGKAIASFSKEIKNTPADKQLDVANRSFRVATESEAFSEETLEFMKEIGQIAIDGTTEDKKSLDTIIDHFETSRSPSQVESILDYISTGSNVSDRLKKAGELVKIYATGDLEVDKARRKGEQATAEALSEQETLASGKRRHAQATADIQTAAEKERLQNKLKATASAATTAEERRQTVLEERGLSPDLAFDIANGHVKTVEGKAGEFFTVNRVTREQIPLKKKDKEVLEEFQLKKVEGVDIETPSLFEDALIGTGPYAGVQKVANFLGAFIDAKTFRPDITEARIRLNLFKQNAIKALSKNRRNPVKEVELISKFLPEIDSFTANPDEVRLQIKALRNAFQDANVISKNELNNKKITLARRTQLKDDISRRDEVLAMGGLTTAPSDPETSEGPATVEIEGITFRVGEEVTLKDGTVAIVHADGEIRVKDDE